MTAAANPNADVAIVRQVLKAQYRQAKTTTTSEIAPRPAMTGAVTCHLGAAQDRRIAGLEMPRE